MLKIIKTSFPITQIDPTYFLSQKLTQHKVSLKSKLNRRGRCKKIRRDVSASFLTAKTTPNCIPRQ